MVNVVWEPLPGSQTTILTHPWVFELLYHGTRGPGKTDTLLMDFAQFVGKGFGIGYKGIIFRQSFPQLDDLLTKSKKWFPRIFPGVRWLGNSYKWRWGTGEELLFRQFDKPDDYWKYHGHEYQYVGWDELTNWPTLEGYTSMFSCLRSTNKDIPLRMRATTNPYGPGHNIVKHHFQLPQKDGVIIRKTYRVEQPGGPPLEKKLTRLAIKGTIYENTILLDSQPEYIAQIKKNADNPAKLAAWLEGSWDIVAGGLIDDVWEPKYNVVKPFTIPSTWRLDRSFDWGSSRPFSVGWWAESDGSDYVDATGQVRSSIRGDIFRIGEWYGWTGVPNKGVKMLAKDIAKGIRVLELQRFPNRKVNPGPADSAIYTVENGRSVAQDMSKHIVVNERITTPGIHWVPADKSPGSRVAGWEALRSAIKGAHPAEFGPREMPGLFVFDNCAQFLRTVPVLPRDEKNPDDANTDAEDHVADEVRYRVRSAGRYFSSGTTTGGH